MIKITFNVDENEVIRGVSLWGHATHHDHGTAQSICFAVSSLMETIYRIDPESVRSFDKGEFCYEPCINTLHPTMEDEHKFTLLEVLFNELCLLATTFSESFTIERRKIHYDN